MSAVLRKDRPSASGTAIYRELVIRRRKLLEGGRSGRGCKRNNCSLVKGQNLLQPDHEVQKTTQIYSAKENVFDRSKTAEAKESKKGSPSSCRGGTVGSSEKHKEWLNLEKGWGKGESRRA